MNDATTLADSPAPETVTAGSSAQNPAPDTGGPAAAAGDGWLSGLPDEARGFITNKGWQKPGEMLDSYRQLETAFGADKAGRTLLMPKDGEDKEAFEPIYKALGRPDDAAGYELDKVLEGEAVDDNFLGLMSKTMHGAGLTKNQAASLAKAYQDHYNEVMANAFSAHEAAVEKARRELTPANVEMYKRGLAAVGIAEKKDQRLIEEFFGPAKAAEIFGGIGALTGEDRGVNGAEGSGLTGGGAEAEIARLKADPLFLDRYLNSEPAAVARMTELYRQAAAGKKAEVL